MAKARVNDVDLYYEVSGSGRPLVLTHGSWGDATAWHGVLPSLAPRFQVVVWDRRGHTRSSDGPGSGSLHEDAEDLAGLIEYLRLSGTQVYGTSAGGIVVLNLVALRPDLVSRAAVHEPPVMELLQGTGDAELVRALNEQQQHLDKVRSMIESGTWGEAAEYFFDNVAVGPGAWGRFPEPVRNALEANAPTYAGELATSSEWAVDPGAIAATGVPILISQGTESPAMILAATRELVRRVPSARAVTLDGSGHVPYRTHPDIWLESLMGFFD